MEIQKVDGKSVDGQEDHWVVNCPNCDKEIEYTGYFDPDDLTKCSCGITFKTNRIYFEDDSYLY